MVRMHTLILQRMPLVAMNPFSPRVVTGVNVVSEGHNSYVPQWLQACMRTVGLAWATGSTTKQSDTGLCVAIGSTN